MTELTPRPLIVAGSIAYDDIAEFSGRFTDHITGANLDKLSIAFVVDRVQRRRGGTAGNVSYTLGLLGAHPLLVGAVGLDFREYNAALQSVGVNTNAVRTIPDLATANAHILGDCDGRQICTFCPSAMSKSADIDLRSIAVDTPDNHVLPPILVLTPDDPAAMRRHAHEGVERGWEIVFSPGQQLAFLADDALRECISAARIVVVNEFEAEMIRTRFGQSATDLASGGRIVIVTRGSSGSEIRTSSVMHKFGTVNVSDVVDTTGAGDAYLGGFLYAYSRGYPLKVAGRYASLAAGYAIEQSGGQEHHYTPREFQTRLEKSAGIGEPAQDVGIT